MSQLSLEQLIDQLRQLDPDELIPGLFRPHSYRGHYEQLAFEPGPLLPAKEVLATVSACVGQVFTGWKGGDFQMDRGSLVWVAERGCCGDQILGYGREVVLRTRAD